jgi:hypothetical protein
MTTSPSTDPRPVGDPVGLRPALGSDLAFIYRRWLQDLRHTDNSPLSDDIWFPAYREHINRVLANEAVTVLVVHPADATNEILGFVVAEPGVLHWVYIKPRYREKYGLCRRLLEAAKATEALASWSTPDSRVKLKNPRRPRQCRHLYASQSTAGR